MKIFLVTWFTDPSQEICLNSFGQRNRLVSFWEELSSRGEKGKKPFDEYLEGMNEDLSGIDRPKA